MSIPRDRINTLPAELLCNIFWWAIDQYWDRAQRDRCRLMLVCRLWLDYIEGSPSLWTYISAKDGPTYVRRALERSKGAMVDLYCWGSMGPYGSAEAFMIDAGPHIARWRSLEVSVRPSFLERDLGPLSTTQPPRLEMLDLSLYPRLHPALAPVTLFGGAPAPPTLGTLKLSGFPAAFEPLGLCGLVSLALSEVPNISTLQLLEILRGCTELESLVLKGNPRLVAIGAQASNFQPIELPKLVLLSFYRMDCGGINGILSNIHTPNHRRRVYMDGMISRAPEMIAMLFTPEIAHLLRPTMPTAGIPFSVIEVNVDDISLSINFRGIHIWFIVSGLDDIQEILHWFAEGLRSEAAKCPVHLIYNSTYRLDPVRAAIVISTPLVVKHLWLASYLKMPLKKALYTAMARAPDSTSSGWLLPQLESLSVWAETGESVQLLVSMLRSRYGGTTSASETESRRPVDLRSIELRHSSPRNDALVEEIRGILGPEVDVIVTMK